MATAVQKVRKSMAKEPEIPCTVKIGKTEKTGDIRLSKLVLDGYELKRQADAIQERLRAVNAQIAELASDLYMDDTGTLHVIVRDCDCSVTLRDVINIIDDKRLRDVLGQRWHDLVREKVTYIPEHKLVEIALDADNPINDDIRGCLNVVERKPSVAYKPHLN